MNDNGFIDYYELLQVSSSADTDTIERVFRHLAKRYHPDNKESGDIDRFHLVVEAHRVLSNPESRAGYDVRYQDYWAGKWKLASKAGTGEGFAGDREVRESVLSLLYVQRRREPKKPGLGDYEMAGLLSMPLELIEFHIWYLKAKGLVELLDTGYLAITALGVDHVEQGKLRLGGDHMLAAPGVTPEDGKGQTTLPGSTGATELLTASDLDQ